MNATQVKHLVKRLHEKLDEKFPQPRYSSYYTDQFTIKLSAEEIVNGIIGGDIVLRPVVAREENEGLNERALCFATDFNTVKEQAESRAKIHEIRANAMKDIRDIEDRLVFTGAHNAQGILDSFESTLNRLAK